VLRAVLDANIYASALIKPDGPPGKILDLLLAKRRFQVVVSKEILLDLRRCLDHPRLRKHMTLTDPEIDRWVLALELIADVVEPIRRTQAIPEDPDDNVLLEAALEGRAAFLVTGDRHVLALREYEGVRIVTAREFLEILG
jgi:putative PIN family toxin of toxin-antitoxin system